MLFRPQKRIKCILYTKATLTECRDTWLWPGTQQCTQLHHGPWLHLLEPPEAEQRQTKGTPAFGKRISECTTVSPHLSRIAWSGKHSKETDLLSLVSYILLKIKEGTIIPTHLNPLQWGGHRVIDSATLQKCRYPLCEVAYGENFQIPSTEG